MKLNYAKGLILIGAIALGSCSTQNKLASAKVDNGDDVYNSNAKAGDEVVYAARVSDNRNYSNDDYYTYDTYSARLNRFYDAPFSSSYFNPYYSGLSLGIGYGAGYLYSPYGYSAYNGYSSYSPYGYGGYNPYYGYSSYSPYGYGTAYGYGLAQYGGVYSYYNTTGSYGTARPYRGASAPQNAYTGSGPALPPASLRPRGASVTPMPSNQPQQAQQPAYQPQQIRPQPTYQPQPVQQSFPSSSGSGSSSGGGGARPVRP